MSLRERLLELVVNTTEEFVGRFAPGFDLPHTFGGHLVGTDAVADVAFTLGWLGEAGVDTIAGVSIDDALRTVLARVDGPATHRSRVSGNRWASRSEIALGLSA